MSQALIYGIGPDGKTAVAAKINAGGELVVTGGSGGGGGGTSDTTEATQLHPNASGHAAMAARFAVDVL